MPTRSGGNGLRGSGKAGKATISLAAPPFTQVLKRREMNTARLLITQMKVAPLIGRRDYDGAVRVLEGELTGTSEDIPYLELIAHCQWQAGSEEGAIETAKMALAHDPKNFETPKMLSQIFAEHEDHEQAIEYAKMGLKNFPSEPIPVRHYGLSAH